MLLTYALCQLPNLLKANKKFSTSSFVPFKFKWRPRLLQSYFGSIFKLLIKEIFLLRQSLLRFLFTSIVFALGLSLWGTIPLCWFNLMEWLHLTSLLPISTYNEVSLPIREIAIKYRSFFFSAISFAIPLYIL